MNKAVRYIPLNLLLLCLSHNLAASETVKYTKSYFADTLADVAFLPMVIISAPISMAGELLFSDSKTNEKTPTPTPNKEATHERAIAQRTATNHQTVGTVDIPGAVHAAIAAVPEADGPVYINLNLNTQQAAATAVTEAGEGVGTPKNSPSSSTDSWLSHSKKYLTKSFSRAVSWILEHKLLFLAGCTGATCVGIQGYLWYLSASLTKETWSSRAHQCSLSDFYRMDQQELIKNLLKELERVFAHANPLINAQRFIQEISNELSLLHRYKNLVERTQLWPLSKLIFINTSLIKAIPDRIQRCTFLHDTLQGWVSKQQETCTYEQIFPVQEPQS